MKTTLTSTLIHEVGHNLGLGHNFAASSDRKNHAPDYPSSSVMDYPDRDFDLYNTAGPYDVAAIRYLYGRQIESTDGTMVDIQDGESTDDAARRVGKGLRPFRMCTDWEVPATNLPFFNPNCVRWDYGTTPLEYTEWAISKVHASVVETGYRYNSATFGGATGALSYFNHLRQIHDYFRYLMHRETGLYFERISNPGKPFSEADVLAAIQRTQPDISKLEDKLAYQYWLAVKRIYEFSRYVINLPSRGCLVTDRGEPETVLEFRNLRNRIFERNDVTVFNCKQAQPYLASVKDAVGLAQFDLGQVSNLVLADRDVELDPLELNLNPDAAANGFKQIDFTVYLNNRYITDFNPLYSSGMFQLKLAALRTLFERQSATMEVTRAAGVQGISFMDLNDEIRRSLLSDLNTHLFRGIPAASYDQEKYASSTEVFAHFREYQDFNALWALFISNAAGDQRSAGFMEIAGKFSMYKLLSQSDLTALLRQRTDIWYLATTSGGYVYQYDGTFGANVLKTLLQAQSARTISESLRAMAEARAQVSNGLDAMLGGLQPNQWQAGAIAFVVNGNVAGSAFGTPLGFALQPLQEARLGALVSAAISPGNLTATRQALLPAIDTFLNDSLVQDGAVRTLIQNGDIDNMEALEASMFKYVSNSF